jgi:hypothetical protein
MAGQNYTWQISTPNINTGVGVISSAYNVDNKSPFTTITGTNTSGYVKVFPDTTSTDFNIKNLEYAIQTDGKITYRVQDGTQNPRQYNSLQELADGRGGWTGATTKQVQSQIKSQLEIFVSEYNQTNPTTPIGPAVAAPEPEPEEAAGRDPSIDPSVDNPTTIDPSTITIGESSGQRNFGTYAYPYDLRTNTQDRIIFTLKEIKGSTITPTFERGQKVIKRNELSNIEGSVTLPIQSGITDSNSVDWSGSSLNAIQAYAAGASLTFMDSSDAGELGNNVSNILGKIAQKIKGNNDYNNALKLYLAQEAVGINGLLSRASGAILNPNLELLFNGPQLRPFNFTFRLSPREEKEATEVRSIIRFFKEAMSVRTSSDNIFLKSPLVFDIKYVTYGADGKPLKNHPSIGRIKTCALLSCDVDYTPDGSYMTFNDSARTMTSYGLSLRFSELDPIYNTDYYDSENKNNNIPTDNIGY